MQNTERTSEDDTTVVHDSSVRDSKDIFNRIENTRDSKSFGSNDVKSSKTTYDDLMNTLKELEEEPPELKRSSLQNIWGIC